MGVMLMDGMKHEKCMQEGILMQIVGCANFALQHRLPSHSKKLISSHLQISSSHFCTNK